MTKITATKGTETLTFQFEQEDKASVVIRYYLKKGYTVTVNDGDETHTLKPDFPKLTPAQQEAWNAILDWYVSKEADYFTPSGLALYTPRYATVYQSTINQLMKKGLIQSYIVSEALDLVGYTIHPDYIPAAPAPEPAPAAAPAPTNPTYDSLKALADKQDEYIQALEARVAELETDMERLAASELELVQQNSVLFHSLDRIAASQEKLQTAARDACAEYGGDMADDAMHTLADTIGYPWN